MKPKHLKTFQEVLDECEIPPEQYYALIKAHIRELLEVKEGYDQQDAEK